MLTYNSYSKSTSPSSPSFYHPISLLSLLSKVLEKHINLWMHNFWSQNDILSDCRFRYCPGFSTESALISTTHWWQQTLDSSSSLSVLSSLNLAKVLILFLFLLCWTLFSLFISLKFYSAGFSLT